MGNNALYIGNPASWFRVRWVGSWMVWWKGLPGPLMSYITCTTDSGIIDPGSLGGETLGGARHRVLRLSLGWRFMVCWVGCGCGGVLFWLHWHHNRWVLLCQHRRDYHFLNPYTDILAHWDHNLLLFVVSLHSLVKLFPLGIYCHLGYERVVCMIRCRVG
jgi:hypothetical protein